MVRARPGVAYDLYARLVAGYLGKYLPGMPALTVENMTGGGPQSVANQLYAAKPDGLTLGALSPDLYFAQLLGQKEVHFDWARFSWIGTSDRSSHLLYMRGDKPYKTIQEVIESSQPLRFGASGAHSTSSYLPRFLQKSLGMRLTMIAGYPEGPNVDSAVEGGEIDCRVLTISGFFSHEPYPSWLKSGFVRILLQTGKERDPRLPAVPTIHEILNQCRVSEPDRRLAKLILSSALFGRPLVAPPRTPSERVKILREAFLRAVHDPELLKEAGMKNLSVTPAAGAELERLAGEVVSQAPDIIEGLRTLSQN